MPCAVSSSVVTSAPCCVQRAQQREPVHARHHQIGDHDRRTERRDFLERLFAVARRLRDEAPALDELLEADARRRIVFDDQHALGSDRSVRRRRHRFRQLWLSSLSTSTMSFLHSGRPSTADASSTVNEFLTDLSRWRSPCTWQIAMEMHMRLMTIGIVAASVAAGACNGGTAGARQRARDAVHGQRRRDASAAPVATVGRADAAAAERDAAPPAWREVTIPAGTTPAGRARHQRRLRHQPRRSSRSRASRARGHRRRQTVLARRLARDRRRDRRDALRQGQGTRARRRALRYADAARRRRALRDPDDVGRPHGAGDEERRTRSKIGAPAAGGAIIGAHRRRQEGRGDRHGGRRRRRHRRSSCRRAARKCTLREGRAR